MKTAGIMATTYVIGDPDSPDPDLVVQYRGKGKWAICDSPGTSIIGEVMNNEGKWEYEPPTTERNEAFFKRCRFTLEGALELAVRHKNDER
jgi:hypothetical protein